MSRINTNVTAMTSTRILNQNNDALNVSLERLSTGLRINRGADDPAGLIASENLAKQITGTETGIKNAERANTIMWLQLTVLLVKSVICLLNCRAYLAKLLIPVV